MAENENINTRLEDAISKKSVYDDTVDMFIEGLKDYVKSEDELFQKFKVFESVLAASGASFSEDRDGVRQLIEELQRGTKSWKTFVGNLSKLKLDNSFSKEDERTLVKFLGDGNSSDDEVDQYISKFKDASHADRRQTYGKLKAALGGGESTDEIINFDMSSALDTLDEISAKIKKFKNDGSGKNIFSAMNDVSPKDMKALGDEVKDIAKASSVGTDDFFNLQGLIDSLEQNIGDKKIKIGAETLPAEEAFKRVNKLIDKLNEDVAEAGKKIEDTGKTVNNLINGLSVNNVDVGADEIKKAEGELVKFIQTGEGNLENTEKLIKELNREGDTRGSVLAAQIKSLRASHAQYEMNKQNAEEMREQAKAAEATRGFFIQLQGAADNVRNSILQTLNVLPGWIQNLVGVGKISSEISEALDKGLKNAMVKFNEADGAFEKMAAAGDAMKSSLMGAFSNLGAIGAAAAVIAGILAVTIMIGNTISGISEDLGISKDQALELHKGMELTASASRASLLSMQEIMDVQKKHIEQTGQLLDLNDKNNRQMIQFASNMSSAYGTGIADVYNMMHEFQEIGANRELSEQLTQWTARAAELNNMPFDTIAKDLAQAAEFVAMHFTGMPKDAAKAAVEVRKLGVSLEQAGKIFDKMINVDSFMGDMHELAAMSNADLSMAFNMRMTGAKPEEVMEEVMNQYDNLSDAMKNNEFVSKKFADTLGMSVKELRAAEKIRRFSKKLSEEELELVKEHSNALSDRDLDNQENLKAKAEELATQKQLNATMGRIKMQLSQALLPLAIIFADVFSELLPVFDIIGVALKAIGKVLKILSPALEMALLPLKGIAFVLGHVVDFLGTIIDEADRLISKFIDVEDALSGIPDILKTIVKGFGAIALMLGSDALFGTNLFGGFKKLVLNLYKPLTSGLSTIFSKVKLGGMFGNMFSKGQAVKTGSGWASNILGGVKSKISKAKDFIFGKKFKGGQMMPGFDSSGNQNRSPEGGTRGGGIFSRAKNLLMGSGNKTGGDKSVGKVNSFWDKFSSMLTNIKNKAGELVKGIGKAIGNFFTAIRDSIKKIKISDMLKASVAILALSGALYVTAKAIKEFEGVEWSTMGKAAAALGGLAVVGMVLGKGSSSMIQGALAVGILGTALIPLAFALSLMEGVKWSTLAMMGTALVGLGVAAGVLGAIMMSGVGAAALTLGAVAIAGLGVALIPLAGALRLAGPAMGHFAEVVESFGTAIKSSLIGVSVIIDSVANGIVSILDVITLEKAASIVAVGLALPLLASGLGALALAQGAQGFMNLLTGDPIAKLERLASIDASSITLVAQSLNYIADALSRINEIDLNDQFSIKMQKMLTLGTSLATKTESDGKVSSNVSESNNSEVNSKTISEINKIQPSIERGFNPVVRATEQIVNNTNSNISSSSGLNSNQIEYLLKKLIQTVEKNSLKSIPLVIGNKSGRELNSYLKKFN